MNEAVITAVKRTAIGKIGGQFAHLPPEKLVAPLIRHLVREFDIDGHSVDDVVLGNVVGPGGNIARLSALEAGLPITVPGVTVDRQCGSGLEAINQAARLVQAGAGEIYIAGGVESTSRAPWKVEKPSSLFDKNGPAVFTRARFSPESIGDPDMCAAAENVAEAYQVTREEQDAYAFQSHQKTTKARQEGVFESEILPIEGVAQDECPRPDTSMEKLSLLSPVFREGGTVTAGNACPMNDGAAVVLVMGLEKCLALKLKPLARFVDAVAAGVDPNLLGTGPVPAVKKLFERQRIQEKDIDIVEFNEAFASQVIASVKKLDIAYEKVNISGGALALGHPYGASGAILVARLVRELERNQSERGLATLGIGGGLGLATLLERL
ncbi:thiolase family protein [Thalassobacillus pellis]|uniref:thiolase family protein n=1 Tax=Thalassobacillus pellis TaxID=748008 RepID=UPI001961875D|nr:thiolase family protein [Thalassobacillus pellis]MBM7551486.1 acetyl-CoA C-acetyltransferase [Thalassobacillus pellis]